MPMRTIDTRFTRLFEHSRHASARPGRPPKGPAEPDEDERAIPPVRRPFDDWPFDFEPSGDGCSG
jgi:hypothetical protein